MQAQFVSPELQREDTDFEVRSLDTSCINISQLQHPWWYNFKYAFAGIRSAYCWLKPKWFPG